MVLSTPSVYLSNHRVRPKRRRVDEEIIRRSSSNISNGEELGLEASGEVATEPSKVKEDMLDRTSCKLDTERNGLKIEL